MNVTNVGAGAIGAAGIDLSGLDIETALMMVQQQRTELLDAQLKEQIDQVKQRNELTASLNEMKSKLSSLKATLAHDAKTTDKVPSNDETRKLAAEYIALCDKLGVSSDPIKMPVVPSREEVLNSIPKHVLSLFSAAAQDKMVESAQAKALEEWEGAPTKETLERLTNDLTSQIDTLSNTQQMDMLRLQSLSNKRNEAFDVMTNFIKKMQDSRSAIIGNMR